MTALDWSLMLAATLMSLGGLALLFLAWKQPGKPGALATGWLLLTGAVISGYLGNGDRGVAQICVIAMMFAFAWFTAPLLRGLTPPRGHARRQRPEPATAMKHPVAAGLGGVWAFIICGPVAGAIALYGAAVLFKLLRPETGNPATAGIISIIAAVTGWAIVSTLLLIEPRPGRRSAYAGVALAAVMTAALV